MNIVSVLLLWAGGILIGISIGLQLYPTVNPHPYDRCSTMYESLEDISECIWILNNEQ